MIPRPEMIADVFLRIFITPLTFLAVSPSPASNATEPERLLILGATVRCGLPDLGGKLGRAWSETDEERTDREMVIADLLTGQYSDPVRVVVFNTAERWSRDVSEGDRRRAAAAPGRRGPRSSCQPRGIRRPASQRPAGAVAAAATGRGLDSQFRDEILIFRPMLKRFEF